MKDFFNLKKSKLLLFTLLTLIVGGVSPAVAQSLTVYDGTATNSYVPMYGNWADAYLKCEYIIPASDLASIKDKKLTGMKFYASTNNAYTGTFQIFLAEVENTAPTAYIGPEAGTTVYEGKFVVASKEAAFTFSTPYEYQGGNLLVGVYQTVKGSYTSNSFYGVKTDTQSAIYGYNSSSLASVTATAQYFIPKTTFFYQVEGPALTVYGADGSELSSPASYNFGLATAGTTAEFTMKNPGTQALNVTLSSELTLSKTAATIDAESETTFTVAMPDASITDKEVVITPETSSGLEPFTIKVSGTYRDPSKVFVDFADGKLPEGWTATGYSSYYSTYNWKYTAATATSVGYATFETSSGTGTLTSPALDIAEGEKIYIDYARYGSSTYSTAVLKIETSADGETWQTAGSASDAVYGTWKTLEATAPAAAKYMRITGSYIHITNLYGGSLPKNPVLSFSQADYDFGFINEATASTAFTVKNAGGGAMTDLSITSDNDAFTIGSYDATVAIGGETTFTVTLTTAKAGAQNATITVSGAGDTKTFKVSGFVVGEGVFFEDFSGNALPDGWENTGWTFSNQTAVAAMNELLTTPALTVAEGESMAIRVKKGTGYSTPELFYSLDGGTTKSVNLVGSDLTSDYTTVFIEGVAAGNYSITLDGYNVIIDAIGGFKLNDNAPKLGIYGDEACTTAISSAEVDADYGFVTEEDDHEAKLYFKNDGTGTLTLSVGAAPAGFSAALDKTALAKGEVATLTLTILDATKGYREGSVTVTAADDLGSLTINASGVVVDANKVYVDFTADGAKFPAGWTQGNWTITNKSYTDYTTTDDASTIQTTKLVAAAGEPLIIEAKNNSLGYRYAAALSYSYSRDNGETWSEEQDLTGDLTTNYQLLTLTDIADAEAESNVIVRFIGKNVAIRRIYGFTQPAEAIMTTDAADYDFGMQTEAAEKVFTIKNEGFNTLTNIAAVLETGTDYAVALGKNTLEAGEQTTLTVTQKHSLDNLGAHSDVLTITADGQTSVVVNLSGKTRDGSKLYVDFDNVDWPGDWTFSAAWSTSTSNGNKYAQRYGASTITTSPLTVAEGEVMTLQAGWYSGSNGTLNVRYSADGGVNWSDATVSQKTFNNTAWQDVTVSGIPAGKIVLEFSCNSIKLDNISGFGVGAEMPVVILSKDGTALQKTDDAFPAVDFGTVNEDQTAVYTLKNNGTADLVSTVATTGAVTAAITGSDVTVDGNKVTVPVGKTATVTVTMANVAPYGEKSGRLTITSENGVGTINVDFTANMIDPTALFVDFATSAWPEAWYHASNWSIYDNYARNYYASEADLVSPKLSVAGVDDELTFKAWAYSSYNAATLKIYYSKDRAEWTEYTYDTALSATDHNTITVKGLEAGEYYLKLTGSRVCVDDFAGWHLVQGIEHDLYVATSNIPTATKVPETSITATATVTSLIAAETGVYAKLFFDDTEVAAATAADIAKNGSKVFTLTGNVPAEEKTYAAKIVVYYSDDTVAFTTATTEVEVAHTRTLKVTAFALTSEAEVTADADNKFTATFDVTVQNTGTVALEADKVSASITDGDAIVYQTVTATETLAKEGEVTLHFTVTTSALEGGAFTFKTKENLSNTTYATAQTVNVNAAAPKFELAEKDGEAVSDGTAVNFGLVRQATTKTYVITNSGAKALELVSIVAPEGYETTALTEANKTIAVGATLDIDITLKALQGYKAGDLVFTYQVDASTQKTFTLKLSGQSIAEDLYVETFDTEIPTSWTGDIDSYDWQWNSTYQAAYSGGYNSDHKLISPRLAAKAGDELTFDVNFTYSGYTLKAEYSADDKATWTEIGTYDYDAQGTKVFTAPADGNYFLRFTATRYALIDNIIGFKLAPYLLDENDGTVIAGNYVDVELARTFNAGWNTVCLPFAVAAADVETLFGTGAKVFAFTDYTDDGELKFTKSDADMESGTPYIIYVESNITEHIMLTDVEIASATAGSVAKSNATFQGTYKPMKAGQLEGKWGVTDEAKIAKGTAEATMKGFRAYLQLPESATARLVLYDEDGVVTGISAADIDRHDAQQVYNLQGQKLTGTAKKGLYIVGGKKTVIR